ncbi:MAG: hypothetical protein Q9216_002033 [Gyalolechia sp. 2 TL-2023]
MPPDAIVDLIQTGKVALDLLAQRAGGDTANLNVPRIRWERSGLVIEISDATAYGPQPARPRPRFDEIRAVYEGVEAAIGDIGNVAAGIRVFRRGSMLRRIPAEFIAFGFIKVSPPQNGISSGNLTLAAA